MKKFLRNLGEDILYITRQAIIGFAGQMGAMLAIDVYNSYKDKHEVRKPIGFRDSR